VKSNLDPDRDLSIHDDPAERQTAPVLLPENPAAFMVAAFPFNR
jgi:hypothetical protein